MIYFGWVNALKIQVEAVKILPNIRIRSFFDFPRFAILPADMRLTIT